MMWLNLFTVQGKLGVSTHMFLQYFILYFKCGLRATYGPQMCHKKHVAFRTEKGLIFSLMTVKDGFE